MFKVHRGALMRTRQRRALSTQADGRIGLDEGILAAGQYYGNAMSSATSASEMPGVDCVLPVEKDSGKATA